MRPIWTAIWGTALGAFSFSPVQAENLLLITVDTLRADRLSCYGYSDNQTPAIDRWASEGALFERAYAEVPLTLPSHASILTGATPLFHGVRDNAGFNLPAERITLAETVRAAGYETAAFVSAYVVASRFGLGQGFDRYDEDFPPPDDGLMSTDSLRRDGSETTARLLEWLRGRDRDRPFLAWLHLYDPHTPHRGGYDREVSRVDAAVGTIDAELRRSRLLDDTHVILVADHGEGLGEHGEATHGFFIYDSTLQVPWIIRPAKSLQFQVERVREPHSLVDVMPTVLQMLGLEIPAEVQGRGALRALSGRPERARPLYSECLTPQLQFGWSPLHSLRSGRFKFIEAPRPELYDLEEDPEETRNLFAENQAVASRLRRQLLEFEKVHAAPGDASAAASLNSEDAARLAALGYVATGSSPASGQQAGADPKDRIEVFEQYQRVLAALHEGGGGDVFQSIAAIRKVDPATRGLSYLEGLAWEREGRLDNALDAYEKAVSEEPDNVLALGSLARAYLRLRMPEKAEAAFRRLLRRDPQDYRSRNNLALLLRMRGQEDEAMRQLQEVVKAAPRYASGWINLGLGQARRGQMERAEASLKRAVELDSENAAAFFYLARVLRAQGKREEAREALQTAMRLDPRLGSDQR